MPNSTRMQWPYPSENQDPWFDAIEAFFLAADASGYAGRENDNAILTDGGTISFDANTGVVDWTQPINILAVYSGYKWTVPIGQVALDDGQLAYVTLTRAPSTALTVIPSVSYTLPSSDNAYVLMARSGSNVYIRNGASVADGGAITPITGSAAATAGVTQIDANLTTANDTITTIYTYATATNDALYMFDLSYTAIDKTANEGFQRGVRVLALRDELAALTVLNQSVYSEHRDDPTWETYADTDGGTNLRLRVKGDAANSVVWNVFGTVKVNG